MGEPGNRPLMPSYRSIGIMLWLVAGSLFFWVVLQLPLDSIVQTMSGLSWRQWLLWGAINVLVLLLSTCRWQVLSSALGQPVKFTQLLLVRQAGQLISFLTPGPQFGGEPFQIFWLYRSYKVPVHSAVLGLCLDRFYELWINFSLLVIGVLLLQLTPGMNATSEWRQVLVVLLLLLLLLSLLGWAVLRRPQWLAVWLENSARRWLQTPRLQSLGAHWFALGTDLQYLTGSKRGALWSSLVISLLGWVAIVGEMVLVLGILDIEVGHWGILFVLVATRLALLLPLPGGIGTLEASVLWSFQILGLPATAALGLIALMRLRDAAVLLVGLCCLHLVQPRAD